MTLANWFRGVRSPYRSRQRPLNLEVLEERVVLDVRGVDLGPLHFFGDFTVTNNVYSSSGIVQLGLAPTAGESFTPLVTIDPNPSGSVSFAANGPSPMFTVANARVESTTLGVDTLWQTAGSFTFDANALASSGVRITSGAQSFAVEDGPFTLNDLRFFNPGGGSTTDAQVRLQGSLGQPVLVGTTLVVGGDNFVILDQSGVTLTGVESAVSGGLSVGGLGFDVSNLAVSYNSGQFSLTGATSFSLGGESVTANFVSPGLVISGGVVQDFNLALTGDLGVGGLHFTTDNLQVDYDAGTQTYTVTGAASLALAGESLAVTFGGGGTNGLVIQDGTLTELDVAFVGSFHLLELELQAGTATNPLTITYDRAQDRYTMSGQVSVPELFGASVILGTQSQPGIVIQDGHFHLDRFTIQLSDVPLGGFILDNLAVTYTTTRFDVALDVWFPEGWKVGGNVDFVGGELNSIGFNYQATAEGIEIGDTGVEITGLQGEMQNLEHPSDLIVSGSLTAAWGANQLIEVSGGFLIDRYELVLDGSVSVLDGLISGSGRVVLDWGAQDYSAEVKLGWYDGTLTFDAIIDLSGGGDDLYVKAEADVNVPDHIPFIGGKTLAGLDFVLEWHAHQPLSNSFVAVWTDIHLLFFSVDIGIKIDFDKNVSVIGSSDIHDIDSPPPANPTPQIWTYDIPFTVPQNATHATLHVQWPDAAGNQSVAVVLTDGTTTIDQDTFSDANGLTLVPQFNTRKGYLVGMVGSATDAYQPLTAGTYVLRLTSNYQFSSQPKLTAAYGYARPTATVGAVPPNPSDLQVTVPLSGKVVTSLGPNARATLFVDGDGQGYDGSPVANARNLPVTVDAQGNWSVSVPWNLDGLLPLPYYVYAAISDGVNGTVFSGYSSGVTPQPPLSGFVTNPNNAQGLSGMTVYVDVNNDGQFDPATDHYTTTGITGYYSFGSSELPQNTPFYIGVVIPFGYQVHPGTPTVFQVTYDGVQPLTPPSFQVDEFTAIHGTITADFNAGSKPLAGWTVYLDANDNGTLDPGETSTLTTHDGSYAFHNVPRNTTQVVRIQVPSTHYQTGPAGNGSITVVVGGGEFTIYENNDFTALPFSTVSGTVSGYALQNGSLSSSTTNLQGWTVLLTDGSLDPVVAVNAGGGPDGEFESDRGFSGGQTFYNSNAIDTSGVVNPAPESVYQTFRFDPVTFGYTITGLTPGAAYAARLHFVEHYYTSTGQRLFDVTANGTTVLVGYDIFAAAGATNRAVAATVAATADANGRITFQFTGRGNEALVNAIEVLEVVGTTTTASDGSYNFGNLRAGAYSVTPVVPPGWREIDPFTSDLQLQYPDVGQRWHVPGQGQTDPNSVAVADFDGDGRLDFAVLDPNHNMVWIYYNGNFDTPAGFQLASGSPTMTYRKLVVGDFYGTGSQDIAVLGEEVDHPAPRLRGRVDVLRNTGSGAFDLVPAQWYLIDHINGPIGDMVRIGPPPGGRGDQLAVTYWNRQGFPVLTSLWMDGAGFPHATTVGVPGTAVFEGLAGGDLNGDGYSDVLITDHWETAKLAYGTGTGGFVVNPIAGLPPGQAGVVGDINGDGLTDLGVFGTDGQFTYAIQDQAGNFTVYKPGVGTGHPQVSAVLRDINGDLKPDLVWVAEGAGVNALFVALNTGQDGAWFTPAQQTTWSLAPGAQGGLELAAGDMNGDGLLDLVITDESAGNVEIVYNRSVTSPTSIPVTVDGNHSTGNDFVAAQWGQVAGRVYEDVSRDGAARLSKPGRAGVTVFVDLNRNGRLDAGEPKSVTGPHGAYAFTGLADGTYRVGVAPEDGWSTLAPAGDFAEVAVRGGATALADFGRARRLLVPVADQHVVAGQTVTVSVQLTDASGGRRMIFSLGGGVPAGARIDPDTGLFTWTASGAGPQTVTVRVQDALDPLWTETRTFTITLATPLPPATPPAAPLPEPVLTRAVIHRAGRRVRGMTLSFDGEVHPAPGAFRLFRLRNGRRVRDLSGWVRVRTSVRNGQTRVTLSFRSPRGAALPAGWYVLDVWTQQGAEARGRDLRTGATVLRFWNPS